MGSRHFEELRRKYTVPAEMGDELGFVLDAECGIVVVVHI